MKRILTFISVVGMLGVTAWLIYSLVNNFGNSFLGIPKLESVGIPKLESVGIPKLESVDIPKLESVGIPKLESEPETSFSPNCDPFDGMELSLSFLSIREDINVLPVYLKTEGDVIPDLVPAADTQPVVYHARLDAFESTFESNSCNWQGFDDRLYCMFTVPPDIPGSIVDFYLFKEGCVDPCVIQLNQTIPMKLPVEQEKGNPQCSKDMSQDKCEEAGGKMSSSVTAAPFCVCP